MSNDSTFSAKQTTRFTKILDYFKAPESQLTDEYKRAEKMAIKRLRRLKNSEMSVEDTLKITKAFYENWSTLDLSKVKELYKEENYSMPVLTKQVDFKPTDMMRTKFPIVEEESSEFSRMDQEEFNNNLNPLVAFSARFAERPLQQVFKDASVLAAESGRLPSEEIILMAKQYSDAMMKTFEFNSSELKLYDQVNEKALQMLRDDLSKHFNTSESQQQSRSVRKTASILKSSRATPSSSNQQTPPCKRVRIDETNKEWTQKVPSLSELYSADEHQVDKVMLEKHLPDLCNEKLPEIIPYPPQSFFYFPR